MYFTPMCYTSELSSFFYEELTSYSAHHETSPSEAVPVLVEYSCSSLSGDLGKNNDSVTNARGLNSKPSDQAFVHIFRLQYPLKYFISLVGMSQTRVCVNIKSYPLSHFS